jgi:hypothetical protein
MNQQPLPPASEGCSKTRRLTVGYASTETPGVDVPYLRLRGRWMQDAGFAIGRHVKIEVSNGRMIIEQMD